MPAGRQGFSLIELMITIAIAGIMTAATLVSMNAMREKKAVEGAAREVAAVVRETQNYALTGKGLTVSSASCSYVFSWTAGSADYGITGCKTQNYTLKNGVNFSSNGSIVFSIPFSVISPAATADIALNKGSNYHVCVYVSGVVEERPGSCN
jgi:prepilin-type N-terminal cleavage/methylation domain-containing protein